MSDTILDRARLYGLKFHPFNVLDLDTWPASLKKGLREHLGPEWEERVAPGRDTGAGAAVDGLRAPYLPPRRP